VAHRSGRQVRMEAIGALGWGKARLVAVASHKPGSLVPHAGRIGCGCCVARIMRPVGSMRTARPSRRGASRWHTALATERLGRYAHHSDIASVRGLLVRGMPFSCHTCSPAVTWLQGPARCDVKRRLEQSLVPCQSLGQQGCRWSPLLG
jgi:hypothetical protein